MKRIIAILLALAANASAADVTLEWDPNPEPEVVGYTLRGISATDGASDVRATIFSPGTQYTVTGLAPGATYTFTVTAFSPDAESGPSNEVSYTVPVPIPPPQIALTYDPTTRSLRWTDPVAPQPPAITTYQVQHATGTGAMGNVAQIIGTDYALPAGLPPGEHHYRVATTIQGKTGPWSETITVKIPAAPERLRLRVETTTDLKEWKTAGEYFIEGEPDRLFARLTMLRDRPPE